VDTASVIQQLAGQTFAAIAETEGNDSSALAEAQIIEQLCTVGRVVVSTYGGGERTLLARRRAVQVLTPVYHAARTGRCCAWCLLAAHVWWHHRVARRARP
jgi:shikimate kinase